MLIHPPSVRTSPLALKQQSFKSISSCVKYLGNQQEVELRLVYQGKHKFTQQQLSPIQPPLLSARLLSTKPFTAAQSPLKNTSHIHMHTENPQLGMSYMHHIPTSLVSFSSHLTWVKQLGEVCKPKSLPLFT